MRAHEMVDAVRARVIERGNEVTDQLVFAAMAELYGVNAAANAWALVRPAHELATTMSGSVAGARGSEASVASGGKRMRAIDNDGHHLNAARRPVAPNRNAEPVASISSSRSGAGSYALFFGTLLRRSPTREHHLSCLSRTRLCLCRAPPRLSFAWATVLSRARLEITSVRRIRLRGSG